MDIKNLTQTELNEMLLIDKVNPENGTLFGVPTPRTPGNSLMLVIGTGGCGKEVVRRAILSANQKMNPGYSNFVKFLIIDSALNELKVLDNLGIEYMATSCKDLAMRLDPPQGFFTDFVYKPYPVAMLNDKGASRMRMTGKIKFYDQPQAGTTNDETLRSKINALFTGPWSAYLGRPLDVMIISGTAGGNGSGSFMDIAATVRQAVANRANVSLYGFLMLPDTTEAFAQTPVDAKYMMANGFAALKELESYMSIPMEPGRKELFAAPNSANNQIIDAATPLFDYPILVSGQYETAVSIISETLVNFIGDSGGRFDARSFLSNYWTSKNAMLLGTNVSQDGIIKPNAVPEDSHSYCAIGYAQASIPQEVVVPYIVSKVCGKLYATDPSEGVLKAYCTKDNKLSKGEYEAAMATLLGLKDKDKLDEESLWRQIQRLEFSDCHLPENKREITEKQIRLRNTSNYEKGFLVEETAKKGSAKFKESLISKLEAIKNNAKMVMNDYGPRAMGYLFYGNGVEAKDGTEKYCLSRQLEVCAAKFDNEENKRFPSADATPGWFERLLNLITKEIESEYKQLAYNAAQQQVYFKVANVCKGDNGDWKKWFETPIKEFFDACDRFALIIERLMAMYKSHGTTLDMNYKEFADKAEGVNGINLCNNNEIYKWVKNNADNQVKTADFVGLKSKLINDFYTHMDEWLSTDSGKARRRFDDVLSDVCHLGRHSTDELGLKLSIDDYFAEVLSGVGAAMQQNEINTTIKDIMERLEAKSAPRLGGNNPSVGPKTEVILVPKDLLTANAFSQMISSAISTYLGGRDHIISETTTTDAIVCYQLSCGNPLSDIPDLTKWENIYDEVSKSSRFVHTNDSDRVMLHQVRGYSQYKELTFKETQEALNAIRMGNGMDRQKTVEIADDMNSQLGTGLSWRHYPSVNVRRYHVTSRHDNNTTEDEYQNVFRKKVKLAKDWGLIECRKDIENPNKYMFFVRLIPSDASNIAPKMLERYSAKTEEGYYARGERLFRFLKEQNRAAHGDWEQKVYLDGSPFFGAGGFDFSSAVAVLHWTQEQIEQELEKYLYRMLRKATHLYQSLEDTMFKYYPLEMELERKEAEVRRYILADLFIKLYADGCIHNAKGKWTVTEAVDRSGNSAREYNLVDLSLKETTLLKGIDEKLYNDSLKLIIVFLRFMNEVEKGMDLAKIENSHTEYIKNVTNEKYLSVRSKRVENLKIVLQKLDEAFYVKEDETLSEVLVKKYGLNEIDYDKAMGVEIFKEELDRLIVTLSHQEDDKDEDNDEDF